MNNQPPIKRITIIGGGIAGLSAAYALEQEADNKGIDIQIDLIEKQERMGGNIVTDYIDNFIVEGGPDCVFSDKPSALQLCHKLELDRELLKTNEEKKGTYVYWDGRLHDLPEGVVLMIPTMIMPILLSSLITIPGKLRMALEPFVPKRTNPSEETLDQFVTRRLGRELLDKIAEPLVAGIHAGNPKTMSVKASFPRFVDLEQKYGSLIKGMLSRKKEMLSMMKKKKPKYTMFMTLKSGLQSLPLAIEKELKKTRIHANSEVSSVKQKPYGYEINLKKGKSIPCDSTIIATPSYITAPLVKEINQSLTEKLIGIPYVSTATVSLAYSSADLKQVPKGFGFIVPKISKRKIMAVTYTSNKFSHRAPDGSVLLRCFVGGAQNENLVFLDDKEMIQMVRNELKDIIGIDLKPIFTKIYRWEKSMPQYIVGHIDRVKKIEELVSDCPGLFLTGSAYNGIGISDCISNSHKAAESAIKFLQQKKVGQERS